MRYPTDRGVFHSIFGTSLNGMGLFRKWHNQTFWEHPAFNSLDGGTEKVTSNYPQKNREL